MIPMEEYPIMTNDGKLFCMCQRDANRNISLVGKNAKISLQDLEERAHNPSIARKGRSKRCYQRSGKYPEK